MMLLFVSWPLESWIRRRHSPTDGGNRSGEGKGEFAGQIGRGALGVVWIAGFSDIYQLVGARTLSNIGRLLIEYVVGIFYVSSLY